MTATEKIFYWIYVKIFSVIFENFQVVFEEPSEKKKIRNFGKYNMTETIRYFSEVSKIQKY